MADPEVVRRGPRIRHKSRKALQREAEQARAERLQFLGQLASGLAHEIRNPLNGIQLNIDLLQSDLPSVDESRRAGFNKKLTRMKDDVEYLKTMLEEFLQFARPPQMVRTAVDLNQLLDEIIDFQKPEFESADIELEFSPGEDLYPVLVDRHQFAQVIRNLLTNAREAVGEHGRVWVRTEQSEDHVDTVIADNGGGVPEEDEAQVFEVFYTSKSTGTGLGLAIATRILEEHGGTVLLENRPGVGATFRVRLPKQKILTAEAEAIHNRRQNAR